MQDIPLLVEGGMAAQFPLVVVVHADAPVRVRRLVEQRGMPEADARARIAAQADDAARRAVADVWLDNSGAPAALTAAVDALWDRRLAPFAAGLAADRAAPAHRRRRPRPGVDRAGRPARRAGRGRGRGAGPGCRARRPDGCARPARRGRPRPAARGGVPRRADALRGPLAEAGFVPGGPATPRRIPAGPPAAGAGGRLARLAECPPPAGLVAGRAAGQGRVRGTARSGTREAAAAAWAASSGWAPSLNGTNPDG